MFRSSSSSALRLSTFRKPKTNSRYISRWTPKTALQGTSLRSSSLIKPPHELLAKFHTTPPRQHPLFYGLLASVLKASGSIELTRMVAKVALTFIPAIAIKNTFTRKYIRRVIKDKPELKHKREGLEKKLRTMTITYRTLIALPITLLGLTFLASLERTPLSGRWRVILLSPEEEDSILKQLQGDGWYRAVLEVISEDGPPDIIPPTDWRYQVVETVLRRLERTIPILAAENHVDLPWLERGPDDIPLPPPAKHPLKPRPSAKEYLRWFCASWCPESRNSKAQESAPLPSAASVDSPHLVPGPPYNLVLVERPESDNAFSFGFGPDGGGGIVVYSGFLDRVFANGPTIAKNLDTPLEAQGMSPPRSLISLLMGSLFTISSPPPPHTQCQNAGPPPCTPTDEQVTQLAILLAHELSHLILSHHLETLSSGTVVIPGTVSMISDLLRAVLFPFTAVFGPFVNDAVANLGKLGSGEFAKISEYCSSMNLEFEADAVSTRILAHAGFDARETVSFWERRRDAVLTECSPARAAEHARDLEESLVVSALEDGANRSLGVRLARRIVGATHPAHEARLLRLKSELQRWEIERAKAIKKRQVKKKWRQKWETHMGEKK